jgi:hypothetical protein
VTETQKAFSTFPLVLVRWQKEQNRRERTLSHGRDFFIRMPINRNTPFIVDHMSFSRWELAPLK